MNSSSLDPAAVALLVGCINAPGLIDSAVTMKRLSASDAQRLRTVAFTMQAEIRSGQPGSYNASDAALLARFGQGLLKDAVTPGQDAASIGPLANWGSALSVLATAVRQRSS